MPTISHARLRGTYLACLYGAVPVYLLGLLVAWFFSRDGHDAGPLLILFAVVPGPLALLASIVCAMWLLYRCWACAGRHATRLPHPPKLVDPAAAVVLMATPMLNLVGVFIAMGMLPQALNEVAESVGLRERTDPYAGNLVAVCMASVIIPGLGLAAFLIAGLVLLPMTLYSCSRLAEAIEVGVAMVPAPVADLLRPAPGTGGETHGTV